MKTVPAIVPADELREASKQFDMQKKKANKRRMKIKGKIKEKKNEKNSQKELPTPDEEDTKCTQLV